MSAGPPERRPGVGYPAAAIERAFREERASVLAALIRQLRDFQLAEDALQDAFAAAVATWPRDGVPASPGAWLITTARRRAIDRLRRNRSLADRAARLALDGAGGADFLHVEVAERLIDRLDLIGREFPEVSVGSYPQPDRGHLVIRVSGTEAAKVDAAAAMVRRDGPAELHIDDPGDRAGP